MQLATGGGHHPNCITGVGCNARGVEHHAEHVQMIAAMSACAKSKQLSASAKSKQSAPEGKQVRPAGRDEKFARVEFPRRSAALVNSVCSVGTGGAARQWLAYSSNCQAVTAPPDVG